jgi:PAS domain S-box-containing protein
LSENFSDSVLKKQPFDLVYRIISANGFVKTVHSIGEIIVDQIGNAAKMFGTFQDISIQKEIEKALYESEERFRLTFDQSPIGAAIVSLDQRFIKANDVFCHMVGFNKSELISRSFEQITHPEDLAECYALTKRLINGEIDRLSMEIRYIHKYGTIVWIHLLMKLVKDISGIPLYFMSTMEDITQQREIKNKLSILSRATEQSPASIIITDLNGNIEYVNPKFEELTGYTLEESIGNNPRMLKSGFTSDEVYRDLWNTVRSSKNWHGEFVNRKKNGEIYYESAVISPITDENEHITHFVAIKEDVTERKKGEQALKDSEERFRYMADSAPVFIWLAGNDKNFSYFNKPWLVFTGRDIEQEKGFGWTENLHPEDYQCTLDTYHKSFDSQVPFEMEFRLKRSDGKYRWIYDSGIPLYSNNKTFIGYIGSCIDITEHKQAKNGLVSTVIHTQEKERIRFAQDLHDGLGPLLSGIKLYFQWLSEDHTDEKWNIIIEKGNKLLDSAIQTIHELSNNMSYSSITNNGFSEALSNFIADLNITSRLSISFSPAPLPHFGEDMEIALFRICTELINNTIKYAEASVAEIIMKFDKTLQLIILEYFDNGSGFDLNAVKMNNKGLGLKGIESRVTSLNGKFAIHSKSGEGMKVCISLPVYV